jgi:hypothetical protein
MTSPIRLAADSRMEAIAQLKRLQDDLEAQFAGQHALSVAGRMSHFGIKMKEEGQRTAPFQTGTLQMSHRSLTTLQKLDAHVHQVTTSIFIDPDVVNPILGGRPEEYGIEVNQRKPWWDDLYQVVLYEANEGELWNVFVDITNHLRPSDLWG